MQLLIATDVAARGIDVIDLTHVIHHQLPDQLESYTHRSGRTGRAGKKGVSLAFINPREGKRITELEKKINISFERIEVPSIESMKSSRINHWADLIINTKIDDQADEILNDLHGQFAHLTKEDLLKRLITTQLDHLMIKPGDDADLNEPKPGEKRVVNTNFHRYFINIGSIDGVTDADLVHFLSDVSGLSRNLFIDLNMHKNCSFFNVSKKDDKGLGQKFNGVEIEGRSIRVNRDDEGNSKPKANIPHRDQKKSKGRTRGRKPHKEYSRSRSRRR